MNGSSSAKASHSVPKESNKNFTIQSLLQQVDRFQRRGQLETIERLTVENSVLRKHIGRYQEGWHATLDLLQEACEAVLLMQVAIERCNQEETSAERDWLEFWGINRECDKSSGPRPAGWI